MAIWVLYTECDSEATIWGYVRSKKKAREWCIEQLEDAGRDANDLDDPQGGDMGAQLQDDSHYVQAVKARRLE